jgi:hypothetical protein
VEEEGKEVATEMGYEEGMTRTGVDGGVREAPKEPSSSSSHWERDSSIFVSPSVKREG